MTLASGDLTTPARVGVWIPNVGTNQSTLLAQLITSMTQVIYNRLNRARLYSQTFVRTFDGTGNYQLVLPDYPVVSISKVQIGAALISPSPLPDPTSASSLNLGYGYRFVPWEGNLPGNPAVLEFKGGIWYPGPQNIQITYVAGYSIQGEAHSIPTGTPYTITVNQPQGLWCRDGGVINATTGAALVAVATTPASGQYIAPTDSSPGLYTFSSVDAGIGILISYSFIPADLEEACIQMIAERLSYRDRIGQISKSLGGQETIHFSRGSTGSRGRVHDLPLEVEGLLVPYISVIPPALGASV